ncbi:ras and Rab interactor 2-like isoform X1 [Poecilia reticulata]|uniref:ras and Rab interactor 2-like isoform X1 n=3 Tax=Poecilia reticulata TaxID=8081 RepID=UPI0004A2B5E2|nr:PREDICTED: ras and Rab interactor 2-like isoform X1 [Poecilia reticulata]
MMAQRQRDMSISASCEQEMKGSFFKLIDSIVWEIGTLKKEMGRKTETAEDNRETDAHVGLSEEVGRLFLQASPCPGMGPGPTKARDSGYDSLHRRLSVLERLMHTHSVWLQLGLSHQDAAGILQSQPAGSFLVRRSTSLQKKVISLRMDKDSAEPIKDFAVKESLYTFSLEGSELSFADLFRLLAFCCISRDVLPFTLKLPEAISSARSFADLEKAAKLGAGFWDSKLCRRAVSASLPKTAGPDRPPPPALRPLSCPTTPTCPELRIRSPTQLDCCLPNGALCFINPLFIKVYQPDGGNQINSARTVNQLLRDESNNKISPTNRSERGWFLERPQTYSLDLGDESQRPQENVGSITTTPCSKGRTGSNQALGVSPSPPPRPPPPRLPKHHPTPPIQKQSMPEKVAWINIPKEEEKEKSSNLFSRLGSSLSISPSSSPPKRLSISSPISIPRRTLPLPLTAFSSSPRRSKASPSSSHEDAQCHLALEEQTIEKAILRTKLSKQKSVQSTGQGACSASEPLVMTGSKLSEVTPGEASQEDCTNGGQRLSDMSLSTDSSDSLDYSQSSAFFIPPLHDPSPPTVADFNTHLPLSIPPSHLRYSSIDIDDDVDDDDDEEEEPDYGVGLESDQDQDLTMLPPGAHTKRRTSASALVLQKALQGKFRKMSGVFNSLLTPEKRAIRKVLEMSKDKNSYFGSLVQDYLSYMGEGAGAQAWQGYTSGLELLQTIRQFITQMKSYLRQTSEMEPPIESLIPEDQIDRVLEKAMLKCVLKPLKPAISAALKEFQVRSGSWQELRENLSLAKARRPQEMGVADALPPDPVAIEKIRQKFQTMCKLYSPEKKVCMLLRVCKLIYTIMEDNSGRLYGADDFLPMLTYVLAQCDMPELDNEILYMMELLDPSLLHGEGGYYLTSAYGAMSLVKNFQEDQAARVLSSETRDTLHQWHRRRTTQRSAPSIDDFQNYLRVALQELDSGCTAKTLPVRPYTTVEELCQLCALKFKVSDPKNYGLFLQMEGSSQQLAADTHPQKIKAELHSRPQPVPFHFVYRRMTKNGTLSASLSSTPVGLSCLAVAPDPQANLNHQNTDPQALCGGSISV